MVQPPRQIPKAGTFKSEADLRLQESCSTRGKPLDQFAARMKHGEALAVINALQVLQCECTITFHVSASDKTVHIYGSIIMWIESERLIAEEAVERLHEIWRHLGGMTGCKSSKVEVSLVRTLTA